MKVLIRKIWYWSWGLLAGGLILLAIVMSTARILLPYAAGYKKEIEDASSQVLGYTVKIEAIGAAWDILEPGLKLTNIGINDNATQAEILAVSEVIVTIDLFESLANRTFVPDDIILIGTELMALRNKNGQWVLQGLLLPAKSEESEINIQALKFLEDKELRVANSRVNYRDELLNFDYQFNDVNIAIRNSSEQYNLYFSVDLPEHLGKHLSIGFELSGNYQQYTEWTGEAYIKGVGINLSEWTKNADEKFSRQSGVANIELWMELDQQVALTVQGNVSVEGLLLNGIVIDKVSTDLFSEKRDGKYFLNLDNFKLASNNQLLDSYGMTMLAGLSPDYKFQSLQLAVDYLNVSDVVEVSRPFLVNNNKQIIEQLDLYQPGGELQNVYINWSEDEPFEASAFFSNIQARAEDDVLSLKGLSGSLKVKNNAALVALDSQGISAESVHLFRVPLVMDKLIGNIALGKTNDVITIVSDHLEFSNAHISGDMRIGLRIEKGKSPYMDLTANYHNGDAAYTSRYLPVNHMPEKVVEWLDNGVKKGRVVKGDAEIRGDMSKYPFYNNEGIFRIEFDFEDFTLNYFEGWPESKSLGGHAKFFGPGLFIDIHHAVVDSLVVIEGTGVFENLKTSGLQLDVIEQGSVSAALSYIRNSPLRNNFSAVIDDIQGTGEQTSLLSMYIPMYEEAGFFNGETSLRDTGFAFPAWNLLFKNIDTRFIYSDESFDAGSFTAMLNNKPADISINTDISSDNPRSVIKISGQLSANEMLQHHFQSAAPYVSGDFYFNSSLNIPLRNDSNKLGAQLTIGSDLLGVSSKLPLPLDKKDDETASVEISVDFLHSQEAVVNIRYDQWLQGALVLHKPDEKLIIRKSDWRFNSSAPRLPASNEMTLSGQLPKVNIDEWESLNLFNGDGAESVFINANVKVEQLSYLGNSLNPVQVNYIQNEDAIKIIADSEAMKGEIAFSSKRLKTDGVSINLEHINFNKLGNSGKRKSNPEDIIPLNFTSKKVFFNDWQLENINMVSTPIVNGLKMHTLAVNDPFINVRAEGEWLNRNGGQVSNFHINLSTEDAGEALGRLGYAKLVKGGKGSAIFNLNWEAAPTQFDLGNLWGSANLSFKNGQIIDLEPGAGGRLFGLISLQALPRRLAFDFKDVFSEGFNFDKISGNFSFASGNAYTSDFKIDGSIGRIDIKGRTGLKDKDYDQTLTVLPDLSSSLPVVGAVLGGASGGVAMIVIDRIARLFGKQTDHLGQSHYTIKGGWDKPVIERIRNDKNRNQAAESNKAKK